MKCIPPVVARLLLLPLRLPAQAPSLEWSVLPADLPQALRDSLRYTTCGER